MSENKTYSSLYWKCQLIGWTIASCYWMFQGYTIGSFLWSIALVQLLTDILIYISITHLYRSFSLRNRWHELTLDKLIFRLLVSIPIMAFLYLIVTIIKLYLIRKFFSTHASQSFSDFFTTSAWGVYIAGIRLMAIWLLAYHLYHYAKREIRLAALNAKLELSFKQAQLDNLSSQLNPHFLFNALNTIKSLIYTNQAAAARAIDLMSELLRSGLYNGNTMQIPLNEEINLVKDYLELEKLRMEERLFYDFKVEHSLSSFLVLRMSIQTLVENAVKHGISSKKTGGKLMISVTKVPDFLCICVENPGQLKAKNAEIGVGLRNLKERLKLVYNGQAVFTIFEREEKVCAEIKIPI